MLCATPSNIGEFQTKRDPQNGCLYIVMRTLNRRILTVRTRAGGALILKKVSSVKYFTGTLLRGGVL